MRLTRREEQVLRRVVFGVPCKAIAAELGTAEVTVQTQKKRGLRKVGGHARLVEYAQRAGWLDPPGLADVVAASDRLLAARKWCTRAERELKRACARLVEARR